MGRDFFDTVHLLGKTKPDYTYLKKKLNIVDSEELRSRLLDFCGKVDLDKLSLDVGPFLFNPLSITKVSLFGEFIKDTEL